MDAARSTTRTVYHERILKVLVHIQEHLDEDLSVEELASIAHFSPFHFHRIFRGMVGETLMHHVRRLRLERAAGRLKQSDASILTIAQSAGYQAHASFTRAFRDAFGCSPSAFRDAHGLRCDLHAPSRVHFGRHVSYEDFGSKSKGGSAMQVHLKTLAPLRVAFVRHVGPYDTVGETWGRIAEWAGFHGYFNADTRLFGACYDDPDVTEADKIRYDACISVPTDVEPDDDIGVRDLPGGRYAVVMHEGPYEKLSETYASLMGTWFPDSGLVPGDPPCLEFYLNEPDCTPPEDLLTEIWVAVRDR